MNLARAVRNFPRRALGTVIPVAEQAARAQSSQSDVAWRRPVYHPFAPYSGFDEFFAPSRFWNDAFEDLMPVIRNFDHDRDGMTLRQSSPGYEINETAEEYSIAIDVPGVKASDMTVQLEEEGRVLHLFGGRKVTKEGKTMETKFDKRFLIGDNIDTEKLSADLSDGVLVVKAPKLPKEEVQPTNIPITEGANKTGAAEQVTVTEGESKTA